MLLHTLLLTLFYILGAGHGWPDTTDMAIKTGFRRKDGFSWESEKLIASEEEPFLWSWYMFINFTS